MKAKHDMRKYVQVLLIVVALTSIVLVFQSGIAKANSVYDSIGINQPSGSSSSPTPISGSYVFSATITVGSGDTLDSSAFNISGVIYNPSITQVSSNALYAKYSAKYTFTTGSLSNGEYGWYAEATISNQHYSTATDYFKVDNSITLTFESPTSGQAVSGSETATVSAIPTSSNTVNSVTIEFNGGLFPLSSAGNSQWEGTVTYSISPNGVSQMSATASGSGGISGSTNITIVVNNPVSNLFGVAYYDKSNVFSESVPPQDVGSPVVVGNSVYQPGQLNIYPNSLTQKVGIIVPDTVPSIQSLYFPIDTSLYYSFNNSYASNWTDENSNRMTYTGAIVGMNSPFGTPSISFPTSSQTANVSTPLTAANLSAGDWTIGGYFKEASEFSFYLGGDSYGGSALFFFATGVNSNSFIPTIMFSNLSDKASFEILMNASVSTNQYFSLVVSFNHTTVQDVEDGTSIQIYLDGKPVGWHTPSGNTYAGVGIQGFGTGIFSPNEAQGQSFFDLFFADAVLTQKEVNEITSPSPYQIYTKVSPAFYDVNQSYQEINIVNGTQPWSSIQLNTYQILPDAYGQVTFNLQSGLGPQQIYLYSVNISFTPQMSTQVFGLRTFTNFFSVPMFSTISISVSNVFGQKVGELSNFVLNQTSESVVVYLDLSQTVFQFVNTTEGEVTISANGISQNFFSSAILANNTRYNWSTVVFADGKSKNYNGTFQTDALYYTLTIYADAPIASLSVTVIGYSRSGMGFLSGTDPPLFLYVNGNLTQIGSTITSRVESTLNIVLKDSINQTLDEINYTLQSQVNTLTLNISRASWGLSIKNGEQAPANSTLATETIKITNMLTKVNASFTNSVGQTLTLYLLNGTYHIYLHDNATFSTNITLNSTQFYVIFGQQLLTLSEFNSKQNEIYNNTAHLLVTPEVSPVDALVGSPLRYVLDIQFPNGTSLNDSQTRSLVQNGTFSFYDNSNGTLMAQATLLAGSGSDIIAQLSVASVGSYNGIFLSFLSSSGAIFSVRYSSSLQITSLSNFSYGVKLALSSPSYVEVNHSLTFVILLTYDNGTALNSSDTLSVLHNITLAVYDNGQFVVNLAVSVSSPGKLTAAYTPVQLSSGYSVIAVVSPTVIGTAKASAEDIAMFSVVGYNPTLSPGKDFIAALTDFLSSSVNIIAIIITLAGGAYGAYRVLRRRALRIQDKLDAIDNAVQAQLIAQGLTSEQRQAILKAIPKKVKRKLLTIMSSGDIE